jgi:hypothetical protein
LLPQPATEPDDVAVAPVGIVDTPGAAVAAVQELAGLLSAWEGGAGKRNSEKMVHGSYFKVHLRRGLRIELYIIIEVNVASDFWILNI